MKTSLSIKPNVTSLIDRLELTHLDWSNAVWSWMISSRDSSVYHLIYRSVFPLPMIEKKTSLQRASWMSEPTVRLKYLMMPIWMNEKLGEDCSNDECCGFWEIGFEFTSGSHAKRKIILLTEGDTDPSLFYSIVLTGRGRSVHCLCRLETRMIFFSSKSSRMTREVPLLREGGTNETFLKRAFQLSPSIPLCLIRQFPFSDRRRR